MSGETETPAPPSTSQPVAPGAATSEPQAQSENGSSHVVVIRKGDAKETE